MFGHKMIVLNKDVFVRQVIMAQDATMQVNE